jgi:hypothetical protein
MKSGKLTTLPAVPTATRLAAHLVRMPNGCLEWTGCTDPNGYGQISLNGKQAKTHRVVWERAKGPIPAGLNVLHHCDNPPCCETDPTEGYPEGHLFLGTQLDNIADMVAKGRNYIARPKSHCPANHPLNAANTYVAPNGKLRCRICRNAASVRYRQRNRQSVAA